MTKKEQFEQEQFFQKTEAMMTLWIPFFVTVLTIFAVWGE